MDIARGEFSSSKFKFKISRYVLYNPFSIFGSLITKNFLINTFANMPVEESNGGISRNGNLLASIFN